MSDLPASDDLDALLDAPAAPKSVVRDVPALAGFVERCPKCGGTGRFTSYTGRVLGQCFHCKGAGKKVFKNSASERADNRAKAADRKEAKAEAWLEANPDVAAWIAAKRATFVFAASMGDAVKKYGSLTDNQLGAVQKCIARDNERAEQRVQAVANAPSVEVNKIVSAFAAAKGNGLAWPKLRLADFTFAPAGENSKNPGAIYVKANAKVELGYDGATKSEGTYLGKIADGKFVRGRDCSDEQLASILSVCADPAAAAIAYGIRTGSCSCCGRTLTNGLSIELGIGPICREKFGW